MHKNTIHHRTLRVVMISSLLPVGHYSQILCGALDAYTSIDLMVYTDRAGENAPIQSCGTICPVWRKGIWYGWDIVRQLLKDRPAVVHIQHEFTMYGGPMTTIIFPLLIACIRLMHIPVIVTIHGVVSPMQITEAFLQIFNLPQFTGAKFLMRKFFWLFYVLVGLVASEIVCHTKLMGQILNTQYHVKKDKLHMIRPIVPVKKRLPHAQSTNILYYGYLAKRKGLEDLIRAFAKFHRSFPTYKLFCAGGTICGQEEVKKELTSIIEYCKIDHAVQLYGFVKTEPELARLYAQAHVVVIPSKLSIAASGPLYQARGYGAAVLASALDNLKEEVLAGGDGVLVADSKWSEVLSRIAGDPELVYDLRKRSEQTARTYHPKHMAPLYENLYKQAVQ